MWYTPFKSRIGYANFLNIHKADEKLIYASKAKCNNNNNIY